MSDTRIKCSCNFTAIVPAAMIALVSSEHRASDQEVASFRFDFRTGNSSLYLWENTLRLFAIGVKLPTHYGCQSDERLANNSKKGALRWCG